jgi:tripartite ATP-independent transporter DctM subunit
LFLVFGYSALSAFESAGIDSSAVMIEFYRLASAPTLVTIPLFTFAGFVLAESGAPNRLVNLAKALIGWMPGGLAIVALVACAFFTAFTGASGVTIIALGGLLYPILTQEKYSEKFSLGLVTCCGSLGLLFPPSLPLILYGLIGNVSIDQLFIAGILPGLLLLSILGIYSIWQGEKSGVQRVDFSWTQLYHAIRAALWEIPLPFLILIGIYGGFITASEAASVAAVYVLIIETLVYKDVRLWPDIPRIIRQSMTLVGGIFIILGVAMGMTSYLIDAEVPAQIFSFVRQYIHSPVVFLLVLNVFLLIVGCLMDIFSAIIVVVPLIVPIAAQYGIHPLHLGIIFLTNLEIGYLTPPVGLNLFLSSYRFNKPLFEVYRTVVPYLILLLIALFIITYVPALSLAPLEWFGAQPK